MRTDEAISRIDAIHSVMGRATVFRGYRSQSTFFSAFLAIIAAIVQSRFVPEPVQSLHKFLLIWISVAVVSLISAGWHFFSEVPDNSSPGERTRRRSALLQLCPGLAVGAGLTVVIVQKSPEVAWMLPGLWSILFGLAVCSTASLLPRLTLIGGVYFLIAGLFVIAAGHGNQSLAPWTMLVTFAVGQSINGFSLFWTVERPAMKPGEAE